MMKALFKTINYIILLSMVLFILKPAFVHSIEKIIQNKTQYTSTSSPCSSRTMTLSSCSASLQYTLAENELGVDGYLFLLAGILSYFIIRTKYNSPVSSLFKPPILN